MPAILVVDDQPFHRDYLVTLLGYFGHQASEAGNGSEAIEHIKKVKTDLVITDLIMPTMDGYAFLTKLREVEKTIRTSVIFYSAAAYAPQSRAVAEAQGVRHFLTKPAEPQVILSAVNSALGRDTADVPTKSLDRFNSHLHSAPADPIDPRAVVYVVDEDSAQRQTLSSLLADASCNVEAFGSAEAFLDAFDNSRPSCLVLDVLLPKISGLELLEVLRSRGIHVPVIVLTGHANTGIVVKAMRLGVLDFLEKPADSHVLISSIYRALQDDSIKRRENADIDQIRKRMASLTGREKDLVQLMILGKTSKEIAAELQISPKTVAHHRAHVLNKTQAANAADLVRLCIIAHSR